jgi:mRNA-degrading endonuclease HigB of HigAB toxin-antitoxin module
MRIAGKSRLIRASSGCSPETASAYRAFHVELEAASWRSPKDVLASHPNAKFETQSLVVPLDGQHCVVVAIDYESGIALIKYAGPHPRRTGESSKRKYA